jgi:hypothetical protein
VEEASAAAEALTEQATNLTQLIAHYRVGEDSADEVPRAASRPTVAPAVERRALTRPMAGKRKPAVLPPGAVPALVVRL